MEYRPPSESLPIFDSTVFRTPDTTLTIGTASKYFLQYPNAQGTENLQTTNVNGALTCAAATQLNGALTCASTAQFNGVSTLSAAVNISGLTTLNNNLVLQPGLPARTITFSDGTIQSTAAGSLPPSGVVAGSYSSTNLTVNSAGIITAASNGSTSPNVISVQIFSMTGNFAFPAGTQFATIMISGAGGNSGAAYFNGSAVTAGGGGGAGGFVYINRLPVEAGTFMGCSFTSGQASLYYLPIANSSLTANYPIANANAGGNGVAGTSGGGSPSGGIGAGGTVNLTGFGIISSGFPGGSGATTAGSFQVPNGVNVLSTINQLAQISPSVPPLNYGIGGYTVVNNGAGNDYTVYPAGGAICIVVSYSS